MNCSAFFESLIEGEQSPVVICDLNHIIVYMNPFAINRYHKDLTGQSLMDCHNEDSRKKIEQTLEWFKQNESHNQVLEFHNQQENRDVYMIALRDNNKKLIGYWEKHIYRNVDTDSFYNYSK